MNPSEYEALFQTEDSHWWFRGLWQDVDEAMARFVPRREGGQRWLDTGSGTGGLLSRLSSPGTGTGTGSGTGSSTSRGRARFRLAAGLELSQDGLALSRRRGLRALTRGLVSRLPFRDASFDVITSIDLLCHRSAPARETLAEAARCLAPLGVLILHVPAYQWLMSRHDRAVWNHRRFHRSEVKGLVLAAGLNPRFCVYRNSLLFPLAAARRLLSRGRSDGPDRSDVGPTSGLANAVGAAALSVESALRRARIRAPFGLSVFCVASRE